MGGETALSAAGYQAPSVSAPASLEAGKSYELVPSGGAAANYEFVYVGGTLKVEKASSGTLKAGTYAITANLSMPAITTRHPRGHGVREQPEQPVRRQGRPRTGA